MTKIDSKVEKLRTKMRFITDEFPDNRVILLAFFGIIKASQSTINFLL